MEFVRGARTTAMGFVLVVMVGGQTAAEANRDYVVKNVVHSDSYEELRFGVGAGISSAGKEVGSEDENVAAVNIAFVHRDASQVLGASLTVHTTLFGPTHGYFGGFYGFALGSGDAHIEVSGEGGVHMISGMGGGLFSTSPSSDSEEVMPYVGAQFRAVFDIGNKNGWQLELTMQGRTDLSRDRRDISVKTCLLGCSNNTEQWQLGGVSANALAGLSYQFN